jgi:3-hydroxyacyl-CoA dehydrogenase / 3-hydroxy-2-methylbutyryl-CoA dehydrogenase
MTQLHRTVAIVSGASSGLGAAAASCLLRRGVRVLVADLESQRDAYLAWSSRVLREKNETAISPASIAFAPTDVTDPDQVMRALDAAEENFGQPVNAAISCAGIAIARKTLTKRGVHPLSDFAKTMTVNAIGTFNLASLAAERMSHREPDSVNGLRGCIVNTASIAAFEGQIGQVAYAASKGAVVGMTLPMARDLASIGIRVMTIVRPTQVLPQIPSQPIHPHIPLSLFHNRLLDCSQLLCWMDYPTT